LGRPFFFLAFFSEYRKVLSDVKGSSMFGIVANTFVYPIKGMHGIETPTLGVKVSPELGVVGDRTFALYKKLDEVPTQWKQKAFFRVAMNTAGISVEHDLTENDLDQLWRPTQDAVKALATKRGFPPGSYGLVDTKGARHNADTNKPCVSFLNLASVRALQESCGVLIDPHRFRMNVWVEGLPPFYELDVVSRYGDGVSYPMKVGPLSIPVDDLCERCRAIDQSPESGAYDLEVQTMLREHLKQRGYGGSPHRASMQVMGWLAIPKQSGIIRVRDAVDF
jgi:uncharacterized protein YcbX